jgi:hypothetical protein
VPYNALRDLWNNTVENRVIKQSFLLALSESVAHYSLMMRKSEGPKQREEGVLTHGDIERVSQLSLEMLSGELVHSNSAESHPGDGWDNFCQVCAWLPGNLFIGPGNRVDDPGEKFEEKAGCIFSPVVGNGSGSSLFDRLSRLDKNISEFLRKLKGGTRDESLAEEAYGDLAEVVKRPMYIELDPDCWIWESDPGELKNLKPKEKNPKPGPRIKVR